MCNFSYTFFWKPSSVGEKVGVKCVFHNILHKTHTDEYNFRS